MKIALLTVLLSLEALVSTAQHVSIANDRSNMVYIDIPNPLTVTVEHYPCEDIVLKAGHGTLTKKDDHHYELTVNRYKDVTIEVFVKDGRALEKVGEHKFDVGQNHFLVAKIGGKTGGVMPTSLFKAQLGVFAIMEDRARDMKFKITSFYMIVRRGDKVIFGHHNEGTRFDDIIRDFMSELKKGDKVNVVDIHYKTPEGIIRPLNSIQLLLQ